MVEPWLTSPYPWLASGKDHEGLPLVRHVELCHRILDRSLLALLVALLLGRLPWSGNQETCPPGLAVLFEMQTAKGPNLQQFQPMLLSAPPRYVSLLVSEP